MLGFVVIIIVKNKIIKMIKFRLCMIITVASVIDNELVFKLQLAEKSTWRNGKSLHFQKQTSLK